MTGAEEATPGRAALIRAALRNRLARRVLLAYLLFNISEWAGWIALLIWAYGEWGVGGSSTVALAQLIPAAVVAAPLAALLGRFSRATVLSGAYGAQAATYALPGFLIVLGAPAPWVVVAAVGGAVAVTQTRPAHNGLLPEISRTTGELTAANALSGTLDAVATFVGPAFCAVVVASRGPEWALIACGGLMVVAALLTMRASPRGQVSERSLGLGTSGSQLGRVLRNADARLLSTLILAEYTLLGLSDILLIVLAFDVLSLSGGGPAWLNAALGVGAVVGSGVTFLFVGRRRLAIPVVVGATGAGVAFGVAGIGGSTLQAVLAIGLCGAFRAQYAVASRTLTQRLLPDRLLAAMFGLQESVMMIGLALGTLAAPILVATLGPRSAFLAAGALLPALAIGRIRRIVRLDDKTAVPERVYALLDQVPSLGLLAPRVLDRLAIDAVAVAVTSGEVVVAQGDPADRFYVVESGELVVTMSGETVRSLGAGQWFGELALLRRSPRTATVTAQVDARLWALDRDSFLGAVARSSEALEEADGHARNTYET